MALGALARELARRGTARAARRDWRAAAGAGWGQVCHAGTAAALGGESGSDSALPRAERDMLGAGRAGAAAAAEALRGLAGAARRLGDEATERRATSRLVTALQWTGDSRDAAEAEAVARAAEGRLWGDWRQRPLEYVPALPPRGGFPDPDTAGLSAALGALRALTALRDDALAAEASAFVAAAGATQPEGLVDARAAALAGASWTHVRLDAMSATADGREAMRERAPAVAMLAHALCAAARDAGAPVVSYRLSALTLGMPAEEGARRQLHIRPHVGPTNAHWTVHVPLVMPSRELATAKLTVGGERREWRLGEPILFDDSYEHEVCALRAEARARASA